VTRLPLVLSLVCLVAVLAIGLPLFLRTPIWVDVTYHDLSAWNVLHGGVHYRDVFETNLPGMVWLHALVRPVVGWSHEAIRVVDLLVVASILLLLVRLMQQGGLPPAGRVWFVTAAALFYLFETEFIHVQRDGWMLLPAVGATSSRVARAMAPRRWWHSLAEGLLWGLAVWIKPHVLVPALGVWLVSLRFQTRRAALSDLSGLVSGGLLAGATGALWLIGTGAWGPMWDVLLNWNQEYYQWSWADLWYKVRVATAYFAPFSLLHFAAIPVGLVALFRKEPNRALLAALYLGWLLQATVIQKTFDYAHYPPTLLGLALLAMHRWPVGPVFLGWCVAAGLVHVFAGDTRWLGELQRANPVATRTVLPYHPIARPDRLGLWGRCWTDGSWELKDRLTFYHEIHCAPDWADLQRVADFLAAKELKDRELICWHDATHPLYVWLNVRPAIRYPHVITAMKFKSKRDQIRREAFESPARYVVSDLVPVSYLDWSPPPGPPGPTTELPAGFPGWGKDVYPWNQPVVFRAGRYVVHEVRNPRGEIDFPMPAALWE
jgi:hypothetical protein